MTCLNKKCAKKISQLTEQANEASMYQHLMREHPKYKLGSKFNVSWNKMQNLIGEMENTCLCAKGKTTLAGRLKNIGFSLPFIEASVLSGVQLAGQVGRSYGASGAIPLEVAFPIAAVGGAIGARQIIKEHQMEKRGKLKEVV